MTLTNRHSLPQAIVRALEKADADYNSGKSDATVTSLHEPPRVVLLKQRHKGELTADVSERIASLLGTAFHKVMEVSAADGDVVEKRFHTEILGWDVSGQVDHYNEAEAHIIDWKVLSVWAVTIGDAIEDYTKKLNTYAHILRANGKPVRKLSIVVLFRDWQAREARKNQDYPQQQVIEYGLEVWPVMDDKTDPIGPRSVAEAYTTGLVEYHQFAQIAFDKDGTLPDCTDEEKWAKPTTWAVMKRGAKRASKVCATEDEAEESAKLLGAVVEKRPGEFTRCLYFCPCRSVCSVGKSLEVAAEASF